MKKRLITKLSELPCEFSLSNYAATKDFGIADWLVNLEFRALRINWHIDPPSNEYAKYVLNNSLLPLSTCEAILKAGLTKHFHETQVRSYSVYEGLSSNYFFNGDDRLKKYTDAFLNLESPDSSKSYDLLEKTPMWKALQEGGINSDGEIDVCVNLQASEEQLVKEFREWVRGVKTEMGIDVPKRDISEQDLKNLSTFNLLPYLDLMYWAKSENCDISHQTLGLALFPDEYEKSLAERIRKVVAPQARKIVTYDYCAYLRSQFMALPPESKHRKLVPDDKKTLLAPETKYHPLNPDGLD